MPIEVARLVVNASANTDEAIRRLDTLEAHVKTTAGRSSASMSLLAGAAGGAAAMLGDKLLGAVTTGGGALLDYTAKMEQTRIGFTTLLGSSQAAEAHLKELERFAAETPFEFAGLTASSRRFINMGMSAQEVIPMMRAVGDAVAAVGGSSETVDRVTLAISQMSAKGKVSAEEINQIAEAGIGGWKILETQLGKSKAELFKLAEAGEISAETFIKAFKAYSEQNYAGAMERQSHTLLGAMSTIKDTLLQEGSKAIEGFVGGFGGLADKTAQSLKGQDFQGAIETVIESAFEGAGQALSGTVESMIDELFGVAQQRMNDNAKRLSPAAWGQSLAKGVFGNWNAMDAMFDPAAIKRADLQDSYREIEREFAEAAAELQRSQAKLTGGGAKANLADTVGATDDAQKKIKAAHELIGDLNQSLVYLGNSSAVARTQQRLLSIGITDTTSALYTEAVALAQAQDTLQQTFDKDKAESGRVSGMSTDLVSRAGNVPAQIREIEAQARGGLTEVEKFTASIEDLRREVATGFITDAQVTTIFTDYITRFAELDDATTRSKFADYVKNIDEQIWQLGASLERGRTPMEQFQRWLEQTRPDMKAFATEIGDAEKHVLELMRVTSQNDLLKGIGGLEREFSSQRKGKTKTEVERALRGFQDLDLLKEIPALERVAAAFETGSNKALGYSQTVAVVTSALENLRGKLDDKAFDKLRTGVVDIFTDAQKVDEDNQRNESLKLYRDLQADLFGQMERDREITNQARIEKLLLGEAYVSLKDAQREYLTGLAREADTQIAALKKQEEARATYGSMVDALDNQFNSMFTDLREGGWRGMLDGMLEDFISTIGQMASHALAVNLMKMLFPDLAAAGASGGGESGGGGWRGVLGTILGAVIGGIGGAIGSGGGAAKNPNGTTTRPRIVGNMGGGRASGGDVSPGSYYEWQEGSKEFFMPSVPGKVLTEPQMQRMMQGAGDTIINVNVPVRASSSFMQKRSRREIGEDIAGSISRTIS